MCFSHCYGHDHFERVGRSESHGSVSRVKGSLNVRKFS